MSCVLIPLHHAKRQSWRNVMSSLGWGNDNVYRYSLYQFISYCSCNYKSLIILTTSHPICYSSLFLMCLHSNIQHSQNNLLTQQESKPCTFKSHCWHYLLASKQWKHMQIFQCAKAPVLFPLDFSVWMFRQQVIVYVQIAQNWWPQC